MAKAVEERQWTHIGTYPREAGQTTWRIECPFCQTQFTVYPWSLAGSGKRCPECRARHSWYGVAQRPLPPKELRRKLGRG